MKVKEIMKHVPKFQHVNICEQMKAVELGTPGAPQLERFMDKTVGLIYSENGILIINVY